MADGKEKKTKEVIINGYSIKKGATYYEVLKDGITHCFTSMAHAKEHVAKYFKPLKTE